MELESNEKHDADLENHHHAEEACCQTGAPDTSAPSALKKLNTKTFWQSLAGVLVVVLVFNMFFEVNIAPRKSFARGDKKAETFVTQTISQQNDPVGVVSQANYEKIVIPQEGVVLPVVWGDLGKQMINAGVIDKQKFEALYTQRGGASEYEKNLLSGSDNGQIKIDMKNAGYILNLLWALGLGNQNDILDNGSMQKNGEAERFASTGGWTLAKGNVMDHYSKHKFAVLNKEQQERVEKVTKNIFRPCCGNSVYFPDCNHGMAMLGLMELMASQGASEQVMYETALAVNSYWFPDTYLTIAKFLDSNGTSWASTPPQALLSAQFSGSAGYRQIAAQVNPVKSDGGGGCGV
jgi:hypothetical protein